jgi:hypothetical protein
MGIDDVFFGEMKENLGLLTNSALQISGGLVSAIVPINQQKLYNRGLKQSEYVKRL